LPQDALLVTAPGLASAAKRLDVAIRAVAALRPRHPTLRLVVAGALDPSLDLAGAKDATGDPECVVVTGRLTLPDFLRHLAAADVILALRFPSHGEISGALVRSLGAGRAVLVSAGTPAAEEFPEGIVVPVDPDRFEAAEAEALLDALLGDAGLREGVGACARAYMTEHHGLRRTTERLMDFIESVADDRVALEAALPPQESGPLGELVDEVNLAARELQLPRAPGGTAALLLPLCAGGPL
jgi:glycosyltransferase involved in cell wall biosynthesis